MQPTIRSRVRAVGRAALAVGVSTGLMLAGGCVSAVDDPGALGFQTAQQTGRDGPGGPSIDGPGSAASADAGSNAGTAEGTQTAAAPDAGPAAAAQPDAKRLIAAAAASPSGADVAKDAAVDPERAASPSAGKVSLTSFAEAKPAPASATEKLLQQSKPAANGSTLYESLFTQSQARVPIKNTDSTKSRRVLLRHEGAPVETASLPGVDPTSLFEIGHRASADEDALEDADEITSGAYRVASLTGLARLAPNGLTVQRPDVDTGCFQPQLVSLLHQVEQRFGTRVIVTSGYRDPDHNRRVNGAKRSMHMSCKAADIIIPNADKFAVAAFVRGLPGRGGVGTYCYTDAIHVDIGPKRDWNWACRRVRT
ncbi:D-Ala-D-Ala carboxypeptidase family metallohydrolase [Aurantimonas sp. MSK8Z-1]|uniref:YcbK family protein n=1 Tax=Mangrovibrevibacter kandeliae TaxID=2968473 RepID=UPI0021194485|nr:D-Ala-D-Ala carboxypeptidase family metallohydrolase [Aurantimonas sp. MSK8Z-1]MCW4114465.1 D-Ala-D-Ala carboxypeptidase family metallohydrolase [Aurantimonas sp. MSK8Z-1]